MKISDSQAFVTAVTRLWNDINLWHDNAGTVLQIAPRNAQASLLDVAVDLWTRKSLNRLFGCYPLLIHRDFLA
jgi:hypothetical protein